MYICKYEDDKRIGFLKGEDEWVYYPKGGPIDPSGSTLFTQREMMWNRDLLGSRESFVWYGAYLPLREVSK